MTRRLAPSPFVAMFVGAIGSSIVVFTIPFLDRFKIDDVVGAIPVHLFAGIWGTLAVCLSNSDAKILNQILGIIVVGAFVFIISSIVWFIIKSTIGVRVSEEEEDSGMDYSETGLKAYPDFSQ